jgi:hypothetical protein
MSTLLNAATPADDLADIVAFLLSPPKEAYSKNNQTVTLSKAWAIGIIGKERFEDSGPFEHHVLCHGDELRERGMDYGLPKEILDWLVGIEDVVVLPAGLFE